LTPAVKDSDPGFRQSKAVWAYTGIVKDQRVKGEEVDVAGKIAPPLFTFVVAVLSLYETMQKTKLAPRVHFNVKKAQLRLLLCALP
jgi:hypothetical protein